ncbi:hypothetical protein [Pelagibius sp.]|uniref:hypothetical protein n=1 Tax=Pelagibius sp. TaxID=1931238 RepID=UPI003BAE54F4
MVKHLTLMVYFTVTLGATFGQGGTAVLAGKLYTTNPGHYPTHNSGGSADTSVLGRKTKQVRAGSRLLVRDEGRLHEAWVLNPELSKACNKRIFRQKRDKFYIGIVDGRTYGAAVGGHGSLVDRAKMAENQVVYLFRGEGTTDCRVYHRTK